jgi:hypothetical protein
MVEEVKKVISVEVSNDCWKKLKILSIQKEISLPTLVVNVLEKSVSKSNVLEILES